MGRDNISCLWEGHQKKGLVEYTVRIPASWFSPESVGEITLQSSTLLITGPERKIRFSCLGGKITLKGALGFPGMREEHHLALWEGFDGAGKRICRLVCPQCGKRCRTLYAQMGGLFVEGRGHQIGCRDCLRLTYLSTQKVNGRTRHRA